MDPAKTEDLSADEMILVNSFVNARSAFTHTRVGMPPPPTGAEATARGNTALRWIDDPRAKATGPSPTSGAGHAPASQPPDGGSEWMATSQPILDVNEAILWVDDEPLEDSPLSR